MRQTLSIVLATYNEEKNLTSCLESIKDIADEIIIVDGTSTDNTVEIAKKFGAKIKITTNKPNFHINKQMAIDLASKNWILQLDADEHISKELKDEIKSVLEKDNKECNGYWMPRKNWFLGRFLLKGGQYPDYTLRFYKNGKGKLPQKDVHEQAEVSGKVGYFKSALLHYPYENLSHYVKKWDKYNDLFKEQIKEEQKNKNILQKLFYAFAYLIFKPAHWFLTTYFRHKGFMDSWQGFTFSLFSALRFPASYIKYIGFYKFWSTVIIITAALIRLYNFPTRWGLGGDDSRDAMIALEAIRMHQLPLMGSFSSAGPIVFGGIYYWFIMFSYLILPFFIFSPWIMMEAVSILTVWLLMYLVKLLTGEKTALIAGILVMTSPQLVYRSLALGQHTFIATFSTVLIISFLLLWQKKMQIFAFLMGIFLGLALSFHYQAINLLIFFPAIFFISEFSFKEKLKAILFMFLGFLLPLLPLLYWDYHQNFANIKNLMDYFLIGEYRIYVPNSWKLFLFQYFPSYWSFVVGNFSFVGLILFVLSFITFLIFALKKKISNQFIVLGIIFSILLVVNRYYRGERSEGYLLYFIPFIIIFTSFLLTQVYYLKNKLGKYFFVLIILLITIFNFYYIISVWNNNSGFSFYNNISTKLSQKYPNTKFSIYDYKYKLYNFSMPLSLVMGFDGKISSNGKKIGLCNTKNCVSGLPTIYNNGLLIVDLSNVRKSDLSKKTWVNVNQSSAYNDLIGWLNKNQLKSTFNLQKYIMERVAKI